MGISTGYSKFHAGTDWFEGLKRRYPELVLRKPEQLPSVRERMLNPEVLICYFGELSTIVTQGNFDSHPQRIWNCDEIVLLRVYVDKGEQCVVSKTSAKSSNITDMACVNAIREGKSPKKPHHCMVTA